MAIMKIEEYKIGQYIHPIYDDLPADMVSYKLHMKKQDLASLTFTLTRDGKKRPMLKTYSRGIEKLIEKRWTIEEQDDGSGFMKSRIVECAYYQNDGLLGDYFAITPLETLSLTNLEEGTRALQERSQSRSFIIDNLKLSILGVLSVTYPNETQTTLETWGSIFFKDHSAQISAYINSSPSMFINSLQADTTNLWLSDLVTPTLTVRNMIIGAIQ